MNQNGIKMNFCLRVLSAHKIGSLIDGHAHTVQNDPNMFHVGAQMTGDKTYHSEI